MKHLSYLFLLLGMFIISISSQAEELSKKPVTEAAAMTTVTIEWSFAIPPYYYHSGGTQSLVIKLNGVTKVSVPNCEEEGHSGSFYASPGDAVFAEIHVDGDPYSMGGEIWGSYGTEMYEHDDDLWYGGTISASCTVGSEDGVITVCLDEP